MDAHGGGRVAVCELFGSRPARGAAVTRAELENARERLRMLGRVAQERSVRELAAGASEESRLSIDMAVWLLALAEYHGLPDVADEPLED